MTVDDALTARVRAVADAVLYEGYLLYPYRASSDKNQARWQFGVLGPPGAAESGLGEEPSMSAQLLARADTAGFEVTVRFLQLVHRRAERATAEGGYRPVDELVTPAGSWLTWDEAAEAEFEFGPMDSGHAQWSLPLFAPAHTAIEEVGGGRLVRERRGVHGVLEIGVEPDGPLHRISITLANTGRPAPDRRDATVRSMLGAHLIVRAVDGGFVSLLEPPDDAVAAVQRCHQHRCFPVLAGPPGIDAAVLISPIILYDHPEIAEQSTGTLYDSTEIDEILTLRVMTMTDEEKAQARATDPLAARIIDRCDAMSPEEMLGMHGVLRNPHGTQPGLIPAVPDGLDWWDPLADNAVAPEADAILVGGVRVARGSRVRLRPSRRADAQDMFVAGKTARVASVHEDVDGGAHVAVVVDDDPGAGLHDAYGRYLYFSPDEIEPLRDERNVSWR